MKCMMGLVLLLTVIITAVPAQTTKRSGHHWGGDGMMDGDSTGMTSAIMGMGMIMPRQVIPVEGGFVVAIGNKLIKFDNNLNKKQEVVFEVDEMAMRQMFEQMKKAREIRQQIMKEQNREE